LINGELNAIAKPPARKPRRKSESNAHSRWTIHWSRQTGITRSRDDVLLEVRRGKLNNGRK
jgi:hypothetical protein